MEKKTLKNSLSHSLKLLISKCIRIKNEGGEGKI